MRDVTIIIVAWHGRKWLGECLDTLARASSRRVRLVMVDNAGDNGLDELPLGEFDHLILRAPRAMGFAEANNFALREVSRDAEAVCFLNQDTRSGQGWLDACLHCLAERPQVGAVSPLVRTYDWDAWDPAFEDCARRGTAFPFDDVAAAQRMAWCETPVVTAAAAVMRMSALRKVGPFDPIFGSYYEDYDLCQRLRASGFTVGICGGASVAHYSCSTTQSLAAQQARMRWIVRNRVIYKLRAAGSRRLGIALRCFGWDLLYNIGRSIWRTPSSQPLGVVLGAHADLLPVLGRIVSSRRDARAWRDYLDEIGWNRAAGHDLPLSAACEAA
jgi:N-acetylglucosaminyl-diphospho-decaprenol L-rhamnosyltransferase